jgi:hypothetical protein
MSGYLIGAAVVLGLALFNFWNYLRRKKMSAEARKDDDRETETSASEW